MPWTQKITCRRWPMSGKVSLQPFARCPLDLSVIEMAILIWALRKIHPQKEWRWGPPFQPTLFPLWTSMRVLFLTLFMVLLCKFVWSPKNKWNSNPQTSPVLCLLFHLELPKAKNFVSCRINPTLDTLVAWTQLCEGKWLHFWLYALNPHAMHLCNDNATQCFAKVRNASILLL